MAEHIPVKSRLASVSLIFACGTALFSDGYANNVIGAVNTCLARIYGSEAVSAHNYNTTLNSLIFAGEIFGMLTFGYLSDKMGRKFGMMLATSIVAFFSALSAASAGANHSLGGLLAMLSACRFFIGIGIGADYSCGSVAASEQSEEPGVSKNAQHRWYAIATDTTIDLGFVMGAFVPLVLFWIFGDKHLRAVWRLSLGLGAVPALAVFFWRLNMVEPSLFKRDNMARARVPYWLVARRYGTRIFAIGMIWFMYNFIVFPLGIYSSTIINNVTHGSSSLSVVFGWNVVVNLFYMPGSISGAFVVDYLGPKYTLITGLVIQAIFGFVISALYVQLTEHIAVFTVMYGIYLSFGEFGTGVCVQILSSKMAPTAVRGQLYGVAAAIGKVGAFAGIWAFPPIINAFGGSNSVKGNTGPFWIGSGLALFSALVTLLFIPALTHDGMVEEDAQFRIYLESHGYDTSQMGTLEETKSYASDEKKEIAMVETAVVDEV